MSELLNDKQKRMDLLKHMIKQLHEGEAPDAVRSQLVRLLGQVPYDEVVLVEQQLIDEGLPAEEVLKLCDIHKDALGEVDTSAAKEVPAGHPVDTMRLENKALRHEVAELRRLFGEVEGRAGSEAAGEVLTEIRGHFNNLMDVEKHYQRKENLLFPFLEKHDITGPPTVMWGKHDEAREMLRAVFATLDEAGEATVEEVQGIVSLVLEPAAEAVDGMIDKEEEILLPMCLDTLDDEEWAEVERGSAEIGYCIVVPAARWAEAETEDEATQEGGRIQLPTGSFDLTQLEVLLNTIPFDVTFVDADDTVRYFSHGAERIFPRTKAILGRKVQYCHPPKSVDTVERILGDFKAGRQSRAHFWLELGGKFISIEYFAMHDSEGTYLGTLEVSQNLTAKRALTGKRTLLAYDDEEA